MKNKPFYFCTDGNNFYHTLFSTTVDEPLHFKDDEYNNLYDRYISKIELLNDESTTDTEKMLLIKFFTNGDTGYTPLCDRILYSDRFEVVNSITIDSFDDRVQPYLKHNYIRNKIDIRFCDYLIDSYL